MMENKKRTDTITINAVRCSRTEDHVPVNSVPVNAEKCPSENRVEELIATSLQQFAERLQINSARTEQIADTKKKKQYSASSARNSDI